MGWVGKMCVDKFDEKQFSVPDMGRKNILKALYALKTQCQFERPVITYIFDRDIV